MRDHTCPALQAPAKQRLFKDGTVLEDGRSLADQGVETGDSLALVYLQDGALASLIVFISAPRQRFQCAVCQPECCTPDS